MPKDKTETNPDQITTLTLSREIKVDGQMTRFIEMRQTADIGDWYKARLAMAKLKLEGADSDTVQELLLLQLARQLTGLTQPEFDSIPLADMGQILGSTGTAAKALLGDDPKASPSG